MSEKFFENMNDREDIIRLIIKELSGEATVGESRKLRDLLEKEPAVSAEYLKYEKIWNQLKSPEPLQLPDWEEGWARLEAQLDRIGQENQPQSSPKLPDNSRRTVTYWLAAAVLLLVVGLSVSLLWQTKRNQVQYITQNAQRKVVKLPDGSRVVLNNASKLQYKLDKAGGKRLVFLEGEAFFSVRHDGLPFVVSTPNAMVRVLGTQFNVKARRRITRVVVKEGTVEFRQKGANNRTPGVILKANQASYCEADEPPVAPSQVPAESLLGWLEQKITFQQTPLPEICHELEQIFDIRIQLSDNLLRKSPTLTGTFHEKEAPEDILKAICLALDLRLEVKNGKFFISSR